MIIARVLSSGLSAAAAKPAEPAFPTANPAATAARPKANDAARNLLGSAAAGKNCIPDGIA